MPMLNSLARKIYKENRDKGFWDIPGFKGALQLFLSQKLALIHAETSEILEAMRKDPLKSDEHLPQYANLEVEIADTIIRLLDLAGYLRLDLDNIIEDKLHYNRSRLPKHGKNF